MASVIAVKAKRLTLPVTVKPVFEILRDGLSLGYRRNGKGAGSWVVRISDGKGGYRKPNIGIADDAEAADGEKILSHKQAVSKAMSVADAKSEVVPTKIITVEDAIQTYEKDLETRKGDPDNAKRIRKHVSAAMLAKTVSDLTTTELRKWRDELLDKKLAPATVNRTATNLKAALELTARHNPHIKNYDAWKHGLESVKDAESARNVIISDAAIAKIVRESYKISYEFGLLVETSVTGSRYSQIGRLIVSDLLPPNGENYRLNMPTALKGKGVKTVTKHKVAISKPLAEKLKKSIEDRKAQSNDWLLVKPSKEPWSKSDHYRFFKRAVKAAKLTPEEIAPHTVEEITIYAFRHSSIVRALLNSVPLVLVARTHDTSPTMINKHYSAYIDDQSDDLARKGLLTIKMEDSLEPNDAAA